MFKKIELDNYRSFRHTEIDLSDSGKNPLPYAFIYGENGSGKSNLIESLMFLKDTIRTINTANILKKLKDDIAASKKAPPYDISSMAESIRTVGSETGVSVSYHFVLKGHDGNYTMRFGSDNRLMYEKLSFTVESRTKDIFEILTSENNDGPHDGHGIEKKFSPQLFLKKDYRRTIEDLINKYWGKHSFMSILDEECSANNIRYMNESLGTGIMSVIDFFNDLVVNCRYGGGSVGAGIRDRILARLSAGDIAPEKGKHLQIYEAALNSFFTRIYSDVKKAYYRTELRDGRLYYTLFFSKMIGGKRREIGISEESTGTLKLLELFPAFFECARGSTVFYDELDTGIHDLLFKEMMSEIKGTFKGQFVATTHNTSLLEVIDPKSIFVIQTDAKGEKRILPISRIERTQKNHNNRNRYLNGVFSAVPIIGEIDFEDIVRRVQNEKGEEE